VLGERALAVHGGANGVPRARERVEERVALRVDLAAPGGLEDLAQEPAVVGHDLPVAIAEFLQQPRRALDVGEEKGDGPAWKSHGATVQG
jgi:hypothetical protein